MSTGTTIADVAAHVPPALRPTITGRASRPVPSVTHDSRAVARGGMYACLRGRNADGHDFAAAAVSAGAASLLVDHDLTDRLGAELDGTVDVSQLVVADTRRALGPVAAGIHGDPSRSLRLVGVTGTNGKTTTSALLGSILRAAGDATSVLGTLSGTFTTPEAPDLQARLAALRDAGERSVVMEVSSHALALHRVDGTRFDAAVFTNLGRDHLDLHGSLEEYFRAKARLFRPGRAVVGVVNVDDAHGRRLADAAPIEMVTYCRADAADASVTASSVSFTWRDVRLELPIGGTFNVLNAVAAATTASALGVGMEAIVGGLAAVPPVPGRFERVTVADTEPPAFDVVVDYAHTPDGLEEVIAAAGAVVAERGRIIVVFGAGGDRDRPKRPEMGAVAARLADVVVVTSDNPRSERPEAIVDEIVAGVAERDRHRVEVVLDRSAAIELAIRLAEPGDLVVVAGKGHETTQTIGDRVLPFDDRAVVRNLLADIVALPKGRPA